MADPVKTPSETPNQPAVETPAAAAAPAAAAKPADPAPAAATTSEAAKPAADTSTAKPASEAKPAAEAKPAEGEKPAGGATDEQAKALSEAAAKTAADKAATEAAAKAPETYDIKLPEAMAKEWESQGLKLDPELIPALTPALKSAGLTNAQLNTVAASFLEFQQKLPERMMARDLEVTSKDPALGGMRYGQTLKEVNLALDAFGDPDFKKFVAKAGIANRLEFVRVFQRIGEAMARAGDTPNSSQPEAAPAETRAQRMYGRKTNT